MLITRKKFEEELHRERARVLQDVELDRRFESMERWYIEKMNDIERNFGRRISKLENACGKVTENYPACKE